MVKKAQKGNDKAYVKLFQQYEVDLYRMAYVYVKNRDDALDVVQETAYLSFKRIHTLKEPAYFKTWLTRIAIHCSIDLLRKRQKVVQLEPGYEQFMGSTDEDIPLSLSLQDLIDRLSEEEKSLVLLKFYNDHTFKEIAEILEIPLGSAKSILYRALGKLRNQMKEANDNE